MQIPSTSSKLSKLTDWPHHTWSLALGGLSQNAWFQVWNIIYIYILFGIDASLYQYVTGLPRASHAAAKFVTGDVAHVAGIAATSKRFGALGPYGSMHRKNLSHHGDSDQKLSPSGPIMLQDLAVSLSNSVYCCFLMSRLAGVRNLLNDYATAENMDCPVMSCLII